MFLNFLKKIYIITDRLELTTKNKYGENFDMEVLNYAIFTLVIHHNAAFMEKMLSTNPRTE